jgi:ribosome maturation factor RimP
VQTMTRRPGSRSRPRKSGEVVSRVRPIAERVAQGHGLVVWSVGFVRVAGRDTLRVAADRVGGVRSDELTLLAEDLGRELDHVDAVPGEAPYVLEVTSPGAERKLAGAEQFRVCRGLVVRVWLRDGRPPIDGVIGDGNEEGVDMETRQGLAHVPYEDMDRAQLRVTEIG